MILGCILKLRDVDKDFTTLELGKNSMQRSGKQLNGNNNKCKAQRDNDCLTTF